MLRMLKQWFAPASAGQYSQATVDIESAPAHIAIIMDGNGRWAKQQGLPRIAGHHRGMKVVKNVTLEAIRLGVKYITLFAFSTENWKRPRAEVEFLMKLPQEFLGNEIQTLIDNNVQIRMIGSREHLPAHTLHAIDKAMERTKSNTGLVLTFALNYGSRAEMLDAMRALAHDIQQGHLQPEQITEEIYARQLLTADLPDPDLMIRTSGELRLSNFLLWQLAYSEFWFTDVLWPDFTPELLREAIEEYNRRQRRYGGL